jgi:AraC family transcriptional regulator
LCSFEDITVRIPFDYTQDRSNIPYYGARNQFDEIAQLILGSRRGANFTISTHRRDTPGLGMTLPTPVVAGYVAIIQLRPGGTYDMLCDAKHNTRAELRTGTTKVLDLRNLWVADLQKPFHSFSFVIPQSMLDELTEDLGCNRIEVFHCRPTDNVQDPVMLNLARALYPAFGQGDALNALASAHLFQAACVHLAQSYGGLKAEPVRLQSGLARWQERRVKELMGDRLQSNVTLDELSDACGVSQFRLARAFRNSVGITPHRWLLERRIESAKGLLACTAQDIEQIAKFCGFTNRVKFARTFEKHTGLTPENWRNQRRN